MLCKGGRLTRCAGYDSFAFCVVSGLPAEFLTGPTTVVCRRAAGTEAKLFHGLSRALSVTDVRGVLSRWCGNENHLRIVTKLVETRIVQRLVYRMSLRK